MSLLLAGTGHPFFRPDNVNIDAIGEEEDRFYEVSRDIFADLINKDVRDTWWFMAMNEWTGWMHEEETEFLECQNSSLSFPTPKLGAKTRPC